MTNQPITATICEAQSLGDPKLPILPDGSDSLDLFAFHDPLLRKAIVPVLVNDISGLTNGVGTAFNVDGWGTFLTADHVIELARKRSKRILSHGDELHFTIDHPDICPILLLGMGLVFGQIEVPPEALAVAATIRTPIRERDDPLALLSGRPEIEVASDIAVMHLAKPVPEKMIGTLPVRLSGVEPKLGDTVVALGFPSLDCKPVDDEEIRYLLSDGMSAAYGRIVGIHPKGLRNDPTPVVEVEAKWLPGMSGGPVFNDRGEVIALVSRSWSQSDVGCAACLSMMPWVGRWLPTVDPANPGWRLGWAVMKKDHGLIAFYKEKNDALKHQVGLGPNFVVAFGSNRIGSDDFVPQ